MCIKNNINYYHKYWHIVSLHNNNLCVGAENNKEYQNNYFIKNTIDFLADECCISIPSFILQYVVKVSTKFRDET